MKIVVVSVNLNFFREIDAELAKHHTVRYFRTTQYQRVNDVALGQLCQWADLIFCEFAQSPFEFSLVFSPAKHIVVRIHRVEIYSENLYDLNWNAVDLVIFSAEHVQKRFMEKLRARNREAGVAVNEPMKTLVVPTNVYDPQMFRWRKRRFRQPYKLCAVGKMLSKKRFYSLVQMFADLPKCFTLDLLASSVPVGMKAGYGNTEYEQNVKDLIEILGLKHRVKIIPGLPHDKMPQFFHDHDIIVSNSNEEGSATAIAEAMACGCYPIINCWRGAETLYSEEYVFRTPKEFVDKVLSWSTSDKMEERVKAAERVRNLDAWKFAVKIRQLCEKVAEKDKISLFYSHVMPHMIQQRNNARIRSVNRFLTNWIKRGQKVLDLGCGIGVISQHLRTLGADVTGIDISPKCIEYAKRHVRSVKFLCRNILKTPLKEKFDVVVMIDCIEHIPLEQHSSLFEALADSTSTVIISMPQPTAPRGGLLIQPIEERIEPKFLIKQLAAYGFSKVRFKGPCLEDQYYRLVVEK